MKKIRKYMINTLIFIMLCFVGCVIDFGDSMELINNSNHVVYACYSSLDSLDRFPMVSVLDRFNINGKDTTVYGEGRIEPNSVGYVNFRLRKEDFVMYGCKDKKIRFFFIKESTLLEKTWEEIYKGQLYEKRLTFTQEDLESMNWTVVYNP